MKQTEKIDFIRAKELMDSEPGLVILDVRSEEEYITGHAVGAVCLPVDEITPAALEEIVLSIGATVLVYCRSGRRSAVAAEKINELGYRVYDVGSLAGWPYGLE